MTQNTFQEIFSKIPTCIINKEQTFLIISGGYWLWSLKVRFYLEELGIPTKQIYIVKDVPNETTCITYDNLIFSYDLLYTHNNDDVVENNMPYNIIAHDCITTFYDNPLITYYDDGYFNKYSFIPNNKAYTITNISPFDTITHTFFYYVKIFTTLSISAWLISFYCFFFPDPLGNGNIKFKTLNAYFTRDTLISFQNKNKNAIISPCCGIVVNEGCICDEKTELFVKIKNETILASTTGFTKYINLFLRPHDYHHFHSPIRGKIISIQSYMGNRNMLSQNNKNVITNSLIENTKIAIRIKNDEQEVLLIAIGGCFIGSIYLRVCEGMEVEQGQRLGNFDFGSSILLLHNSSTIVERKEKCIQVYDLVG